MNIIEFALFCKIFKALNGGSTPSAPDTLTAGLYQTGAIALYEEQGADAIEDMMITSWDELLANGTVHVEDGVVYSNVDFDTWENASADALVGDLILPNDGTITKLGDYRDWYDEDDNWFHEGHIGFESCYNLTGVWIPDSVTSIGNEAFYGCPSLTSINLPEGVTSIGDIAFSFCDNLTSITIPESVTSIGGSAFQNCPSLTSITIPDSVENISNGTFSGCQSLTGVTIGNSVKSIGENAFEHCYENLTSITIPDSVESIGKYAFLNCSSLESVIFDGTTAEWNSIEKGDGWCEHVPATYVQCSDGTVSLVTEAS